MGVDGCLSAVCTFPPLFPLATRQLGFTASCLPLQSRILEGYACTPSLSHSPCSSDPSSGGFLRTRSILAGWCSSSYVLLGSSLSILRVNYQRSLQWGASFLQSIALLPLGFLLYLCLALLPQWMCVECPFLAFPGWFLPF